MTPYSHYVPPPPPITRIHAFPHRWGQAKRLSHASIVIRKPIAYAAILLAAFLFTVLPFILKRLFQWLFRKVVTVGRLIDRIADAILTFIYDIILSAAKALMLPLLVLGLLLALFITFTRQHERQYTTTPTLAALAPQATAQTLTTTSRTRPQPSSRATKLAAFHGSGQTFRSEHAAVEALADTLNIPSQIVSGDLDRALSLADANSRAMRPHVGRFPLPKHSDDRLLAALTPSDVSQLRRLLEHATTIDKRQFTLTANLASGDLSLNARIRHLSSISATGACFHYVLTFIRRTFQHTLAMTACRNRGTWSFTTSQKGQ